MAFEPILPIEYWLDPTFDEEFVGKDEKVSENKNAWGQFSVPTSFGLDIQN